MKGEPTNQQLHSLTRLTFAIGETELKKAQITPNNKQTGVLIVNVSFQTLVRVLIVDDVTKFNHENYES